MRNAKLGKPSVRKGSTHTEESNEKNRIAHTGKKASDETRKKMSESGGHAQTEATKQQIRETLTGVKHTEERIKKNSESHKGLPSPRKGATHTDDAKKKNAEAHLGKTSEKSPCQNCGRLTAIQHMKRHLNKCDTKQINNQ